MSCKFLSQTVDVNRFTSLHFVDPHGNEVFVPYAVTNVLFEDDSDPVRRLALDTAAEDLTVLTAHGTDHGAGTVRTNTRLLHYMFPGATDPDTADVAITMLRTMSLDFVGFYNTWRAAWNGIAGIDPLPALDMSKLDWLPSLQNSLKADEEKLRQLRWERSEAGQADLTGWYDKPCIAFLIAYDAEVIYIGAAPVCHLIQPV